MDNEAASDYDEEDSEKGEVLPNPYERTGVVGEKAVEPVPGSPTPVASPVPIAPDVSVLAPSPVAVTATGAGGYQEEWIPEHHLKKTARGKKTGVASSGDELSGGETSGAESKKKKGRK